MKLIHKYLIFIVVILVLTSFKSFSQVIKPNDSLQAKVVTAAKTIMASAKTCSLITIDNEGRPRVREMSPFEAESDFTVWFGTNPKSRKVEQIKNNSKVTLYYLEKESAGYVMIHGNATLVNNQEEKDNRWKVEWKAFYPNRTEDYLLIKVTPIWMEVVSYTYNILGDPVTWEPPVVFFDID